MLQAACVRHTVQIAHTAISWHLVPKIESRKPRIDFVKGHYVPSWGRTTRCCCITKFARNKYPHATTTNCPCAAADRKSLLRGLLAQHQTLQQNTFSDQELQYHKPMPVRLPCRLSAVSALTRQTGCIQVMLTLPRNSFASRIPLFE